MLGKAGKFLLGVLLIPLDVGYGLAFSEHLGAIRQVRTSEMAFLLGVTAYLAFHAMVAVPKRAYVFAHELVHVGAAWVSGGQAKGFKAGLIPYLVPVYAILWAVGFGLASLFRSVAPWGWTFFFGLGACLTFHLVFTVSVLKEKQSDLEGMGPLLSMVLILWGNLALVQGAMSLVVPEIRFWPYLADGLRYSAGVYQALFAQFFGR